MMDDWWRDDWTHMSVPKSAPRSDPTNAPRSDPRSGNIAAAGVIIDARCTGYDGTRDSHVFADVLALNKQHGSNEI